MGAGALVRWCAGAWVVLVLAWPGPVTGVSPACASEPGSNFAKLGPVSAGGTGLGARGRRRAVAQNAQNAQVASWLAAAALAGAGCRRASGTAAAAGSLRLACTSAASPGTGALSAAAALGVAAL